MKARYYVHTLPDNKGDHEVHVDTCEKLPKPQNRIYLGDFESCKPAVEAAKVLLKDKPVNGCDPCCIECHTT